MATTTPFTSDANTYMLHLMDGTAGSAAKKDNAETTAARDLVETGAVTSTTGITTPTSDGAYNGFGANKNLSITDANLASYPTGAQTWEIWCNVTTLPTVSGLAFLCARNGATAGTYIGIDNTGKVLCRFTSSGGTAKDVTSTGTLSTSTDYYIVVTFDPSTAIKIYINGSLDTNNTTSIPADARATTQTYYISTQANVTGDATYSWIGKIDSIKLSTVVKTGTDISNYYNDTGGGATYRRLGTLGVGQ